MQVHKNEVTTGLLVIVTVGILVAVLAVVGMPGVVKPLNTYRIYFDNANGIRPGAPVLLAGREIGKVTRLESPVPQDKRPQGHPDYEVSIDVLVDRKAEIYHTITVHLTQQGLMGQEVIDFVQGDVNSGLAENHTEFVGDRIPDVSEAVSKDLTRLTGPGSDLAETLKNLHTFTDTLNHSKINETISNAAQMTDTLKREPWRLIWPSTKDYGDDPQPKHKAADKHVTTEDKTDKTDVAAKSK